MAVSILHLMPILHDHLSLPPSYKLMFSSHTISLFLPNKVKSPISLYCFEEVTEFYINFDMSLLVYIILQFLIVTFVNSESLRISAESLQIKKKVD